MEGSNIVEGAAEGFELRDGLYFMAEAVIGITAVCLNTLVVCAIYQNPSLHSVTNIFICSLAAADICVGLFVAPAAIMSYYGFPGNFYGCVFISSVLMVFTNVSVMMLLVIAVDRFFAVKEPFLYQRVMTLQAALAVDGCVWVLGTVTGLIPLYGWHCPYREITFCRFRDVITTEQMVYLQFFGIVLTSTVIMFAVYIYIFLVARRQFQMIDKLRSQFISEDELQKVKRSYARDIKAAKLIILAFTLLVCFTPLYILHCISLFCKTCRYSVVTLLVAILISHSNSCWNPILYAAGSSSIRGAVHKMLTDVELSDFLTPSTSRSFSRTEHTLVSDITDELTSKHAGILDICCGQVPQRQVEQSSTI
ncbi:Adenosine receptor A2a [Bulinus truncatus]|nr:Adenosine receptor A2a [Bulinus truncatus]